MDNFKYKYSVQFENDEGAWQEDDSFSDATEALRHKESIISESRKRTRVLDLESDQEIV